MTGASRQSSLHPLPQLLVELSAAVTGMVVRPVGVGIGADACLGEGECSFIFGSDGGVEEVRVAQAHLGGHVTEQCHEGLERDAGVDERCGVGVARVGVG